MKQKETLLEEAKIKSEELNLWIEEMLKLLVDKESEVLKYEIMTQDVQNKMSGLKIQLAKKEETLVTI